MLTFENKSIILYALFVLYYLRKTMINKLQFYISRGADPYENLAVEKLLFDKVSQILSYCQMTSVNGNVHKSTTFAIIYLGDLISPWQLYYIILLAICI